MVIHHPDKFSDHRHCGSGDIMFFVVEKQDYTCFRLNVPLLFVSNAHDK